MGIILGEGDSIANLTVPSGPVFPEHDSEGEVFCIINSANPNEIVDGLYVSIGQKWKRTSVIQDTPAATVYRTDDTTLKTSSPFVVDWTGFAHTDSATAYTLAENGTDLAINLRGQYDISSTVGINTTENAWVQVETWVTANDVMIAGSKASETIHGRNSPTVTLSSRLIVNIYEGTTIRLHVSFKDGRTCTVTSTTALIMRRLAPL